MVLLNICCLRSAPARCVRWLHSHTGPPTTHGQKAGVDTPVIIVGAGPAGLSLAMYLARYGVWLGFRDAAELHLDASAEVVHHLAMLRSAACCTHARTCAVLVCPGVKSLVLERRVSLSTHPQAHYINIRTMEVLRPLWGLAAQVTSHTPPLEHWRTFRYGYSMTGPLLGEVDHFPGQDSPHHLEVSPEPVAHLPQSKLVPMMMERVLALPHLISVRQGHEVCGLGTHADGVWVQARDQTGVMHKVKGSFLVAADGANSLIRSKLGIPMDGKVVMQNIINIHFTSHTLGKQLLQPPRPPPTMAGSLPWQAPVSAPGQKQSQAAMLYFVFNREVVGVVVAHDLANGEFVAHVPFFPPTQSPADFTEARCAEMISQAAGLPLAGMPDLSIHHIRPWIMSARVADRYHGNHASGVPRTFLVGDAAHCFPPAGGFGMNTGIQDAHNLAWKLALATQAGQQVSSMGGLVDPAHLLASYQVERRPVAVSNRDLSVRNWKEATAVPTALGLAPAVADMLQDVISAVPFLPTSARHALLERGLAAGRAASMAWTPLRPLQLAHVKKLFDSGVTLRMQFPQEDLGFQYPPASGVAVASQQGASTASRHTAGTPQAAPDTAHQPSRAASYQPSSMPGCRLPHVWLQPLPFTSAAPTTKAAGAGSWEQLAPAGCVSTLDIVAGVACTSSEQPQEPVVPSLVLFVDHHNCNPWLTAVMSLQAQHHDLPLSAVQVLQPGGQAQCIHAGAQQVEDVDSMWHKAMQLPTGGVLLVRPDGHVAWRHAGQHVDDMQALQLLHAALKQVLSGRA